jgi:phosphoribosylformimino-5-aminoimidazole carboxamide ribotide isomerase
MRVIPVLDIAQGVAVHGQAGDRPRYRPVQSVLAPGRDGDPVELLHAFQEMLGADACYVADLDAIQGGPIQRTLIRELAQLETGFAGALLVDAGTYQPGDALELVSCGTSQVVIGLETLRSFADLAGVVDLVGPGRVIFSLDLKLGTPVVHPALQDVVGPAAEIVSLADQAIAAGAKTLLVLDVGRVGTGGGVDLRLLEALRRQFPSQTLFAGGGVLARRDLELMRDAGCNGALVATAIHSGRITAGDLSSLAGSSPQSATSASR